MASVPVTYPIKPPTLPIPYTAPVELELVIVVLVATPTNPPALEAPFCAPLIVTLPLLVLFTREVPVDVRPIRPPKPISPPFVSDEYDDISVLELTSVI